MGVHDPMDVFSKPFYPLQKRKVQQRWDKVFEVDNVEDTYIQRATWLLKEEWVEEVIAYQP